MRRLRRYGGLLVPKYAGSGGGGGGTSASLKFVQVGDFTEATSITCSAGANSIVPGNEIMLWLCCYDGSNDPGAGSLVPAGFAVPDASDDYYDGGATVTRFTHCRKTAVAGEPGSYTVTGRTAAEGSWMMAVYENANGVDAGSRGAFASADQTYIEAPSATTSTDGQTLVVGGIWPSNYTAFNGFDNGFTTRFNNTGSMLTNSSFVLGDKVQSVAGASGVSRASQVDATLPFKSFGTTTGIKPA